MATRATETEVKQIIDTDLTTEQVNPFLRAANLMVTNVLTDQEYSDESLKEIECWLAAHFVAIRDPRLTKEKIADAEDTYQGKFGERLNGTSYGQQVLLLEYKGILAELSSASKGGVIVKAII
jgi:hypothetical protein